MDVKSPAGSKVAPRPLTPHFSSQGLLCQRRVQGFSSPPSIQIGPMAEVEITAPLPGEHNAISGEMNKQAERGRLCFLKSHQFRNGDGGGGVWQIQPQTQRSDCLFILHRYTQCLTQNAPVCVHCLDGLAR